MNWLRVSPKRPCAICAKSDWCGFTDSGLACCMRVPSDRPTANGGWLHGARQTHETPPPARRPQMPYEDPTFDATLWWEAARHVARPHKLTAWACALGLPASSIDFMGACTAARMLCFPMYDGHGAICGIRTRDHAGNKRAITGSRGGVFLATVLTPELDALICEGPTDAAAALALGFEPIGRPSCAGCERHVVDTCRRLGYARVTLCADADGPGVAGAERLAQILRAARIATRTVAPLGHKDLRDWWRAGARREHIDTAWSQAEWRH
ncbi:MAG: toprim domain-containing protein [Lentisphaerae bacterium]|nr:toprim domain-containing protein [Lentisphaerota bacterium]